MTHETLIFEGGTQPGTCAMTITIQTGLPAPLRSEAAQMYWGAFRSKLGRLMGPDARGIAFVERVLDPTHCIAALCDGRLLGVAGFKTAQGAFVDGGLGDMWAIYGIGTLWRAAGLALLERDIDNERFLMDGIIVAPQARGQGIGTRLLDAIAHEARRRGHTAVRLDVIDTNPRARALYERQGFHAVATEDTGPARWLFGFRSSTTMIRPVQGPEDEYAGAGDD